MKILPFLIVVLSFFPGLKAQDKKEQKAEKDAEAAIPVYLVHGMIVLHPPGVEEPPKDYLGAMRGTTPVAIIKKGGKVVGEVYGNSLNGTAAKEADGMKGSAAKNEKIDLVKRDSIDKGKLTHELTTIRLNLPSEQFGNPWLIHSLYFPRKAGSVTFKLVTAEKDFKNLLPLFSEMFFR